MDVSLDDYAKQKRFFGKPQGLADYTSYLYLVLKRYTKFLISHLHQAVF